MVPAARLVLGDPVPDHQVLAGSNASAALSLGAVAPSAPPPDPAALLPAPRTEVDGTSLARSSPPTVISAVVVAGTRVRQNRLAELLTAQGVVVAATAKEAFEALALVVKHHPDTVLLDLAPEAGGIEVIERLMARAPLPIVLTGGAALQPAPALAAGAVDVVAISAESLGQQKYAIALATHLRIASRVRVITHPRGRLRDRGMAVPPRPADEAPAAPEVRQPAATNQPPPLAAHPSTVRIPVVVVGASTGGPPALAAFLGALPLDLPAAIVVVQHMADGFVESLASWLDQVIELPVHVAVDGERLRAGTVVLAPSASNVVIEVGPRVRLTMPRAGQFHLPEVDTTFRSVAQSCGSRAIAVLLTGMGRDGAAGMRSMRDRGAFTIGQDEKTSAVWGMPGAAQALDAVVLELPLPDIAAAVVGAVARLTAATS
jgi:two-component system chemotaxis response regulator CheB